MLPISPISPIMPFPMGIMTCSWAVPSYMIQGPAAEKSEVNPDCASPPDRSTMMCGGEIIQASPAGGSVASGSVLLASLPPCSMEAKPGAVTFGASPVPLALIQSSHARSKHMESGSAGTCSTTNAPASSRLRVRMVAAAETLYDAALIALSICVCAPTSCPAAGVPPANPMASAPVVSAGSRPRFLVLDRFGTSLRRVRAVPVINADQ